jgi:Ca2+-binding EF-hand superfamily protein
MAMARFNTKVCEKLALECFCELTMLTHCHQTEFRTFVEETENQLLTLFKAIDKNNDGKLVKDELKAAFKVAGLSVPPAKLDAFFAGVDRDNSGAITFDEWR